MDAIFLPKPAELTVCARADLQPSETSDRNFPTQKAFANARAEYALRGHELITSGRSADGKDSWMVSRWGHSRSFDNWPGVLEFLAQIGGQP